MKNKYMLWGAFVASVAFTACSENDTLIDSTTPGQETPVNGEYHFTVQSSINFAPELGGAEGANAESRTPASVDNEGRPTAQYMLDFVNILKTDPAKQPTADNIGESTSLGYKNAQFEEHKFVGGSYSVEYIVNASQKFDDCTLSGTVTLKQVGGSSNGITYNLTIFRSTDAGNETIQVNDFPYDKTTEPRGSSLRYLTYNPLAQPTAEDGGIQTLPLVDNENIKTIVCSDGKYNGELHSEQIDNLFLGNELLFCATADHLYVYETGKYQYKLIREYDLTSSVAQPSSFGMSRLTAIVSASFIIVDGENDVWNASTSYFDGTLENSQKKFNSIYGTNIDFSKMVCKYATIDGVNTKFNINETSATNVSEPGRLLLWGDGYEVVGNDGRTYGWNDIAKVSADVAYNFTTDGTKQARGIGIQGLSYCAIYKTAQDGIKDEPISFYITVPVNGIEKNIKITGTNVTGFALNQNVATHIILMLPAEQFANHVKGLTTTNLNSRSGNNGYSELVIPSENVVVK